MRSFELEGKPLRMLEMDEVRASFPYLSRCTYLNTASAGLSWRGQGTAAAKFYDEDKAEGINGMNRWRAKADAARVELASLMGVKAHSVHFVSSTTEGLNAIALGMPLGRGDRVVVADDEFPSAVLPWQSLESRGVQVVRVPIENEAQRSEALAAALDSNTRVLAVSHVHWRTGTRVDLAQLSAVCRRHQCRLIVDGAHAVGAISVDGARADAYCSPVFKWLLSGFGLGFLTLSDSLASELTPAMRGYSNEPPSRSLTYSHVNYPGLYALHATLLHLRSVGWENIHARVAQLSVHAALALRRSGLDVLTPERAHAGIISFRHPQGPALVQALASQSIFVEDGGAVVRVSPHFYNTEEEVDRFVSALERLS
jgi:selenocysteine lyase/cysteine desulfurase